MSTKKKSIFSRFLCNVRGVATVEFAIIGPVLVALLIFSVTGFDSYRGLRKASSTVDIVSDLVSRKQILTGTEAENLFKIADALLDKYANDPQVIISSVEQDEDDNYVVIWSVANKEKVAHENFLPADLTTELPEIPKGESIIVTELDFSFTPVFHDMWDDDAPIAVDQFSISRPRALAKIAYEPGS